MWKADKVLGQYMNMPEECESRLQEFWPMQTAMKITTYLDGALEVESSGEIVVPSSDSLLSFSCSSVEISSSNYEFTFDWTSENTGTQQRAAVIEVYSLLENHSVYQNPY